MAASLKVSELVALSSLALTDLLLISDIDANASKKVSFGDLQSNFSLANLGTRSIDNLSDVNTTTNSPSDGNVLYWNATGGEWQPTDPAAAIGVDHLITLSGVNEGSDDLGTFTGSTITDNSTVKTALQELETAIDGVGELNDDVNNLRTMSGTSDGATNLGTFTGSTITTGTTTKNALQDLETSLEEVDANVNDAISLVGVGENISNLGTFTGSTISDNTTVKVALQDLETSLETKAADTKVDEIDVNVNDLITLSGVLENATGLGTFTGSTISDASTVKQALQDLETAAEAAAAGSAVADRTKTEQDGAASTVTRYLTFVADDNVSATAETVFTDAGVTYDPFLNRLYVTGEGAFGSLEVGGVNITSSGAELNILDGALVTAAELNILDGATLSTTELNYVDGVTSSIQTQIDTKAADADVIKHDGTVAFTGDQSLGGNQITSVGEPALSTDAATKNYVDVATAGIGAFWTPVDYAETSSNLTLSGEQTIDGTLTSTDRVLVTAQTDASENGIYVTAAGAWSRATDADAAAEWLKNKTVYVSYGTNNSDAVFAYIGSDSPTIDTNDLDFQLKNTAFNTPDGSIVTAKIANGAVTSAKIDTMAATKLTGTIADARIASSSITQHEADLTITESQISDLHHPTQSDLTIDHLHTLTGVAASSDDLGTFTGNTIADNVAIKAALQSLETTLETKADAVDGLETDDNTDDLITLTGMPENSVHNGTFTGSTIQDNQTIKDSLQDLETAHEEVDANANDLITLSGVNENSTDLGTFTGTTIGDNRDIKTALQDLESELESEHPIYLEVHNDSGNTLSTGDVVYLSGVHDVDGTPHVQLADANGTVTYPAVGVISETITNGNHGHVIIQGVLENIDTSTPGFTAGDVLYLSETAGDLTNTKPTDSGSKVQAVAICIKSNVSSGSILVGGIGGGSTDGESNTLIALTGVAAGSTDLGTFTGSTIQDNVAIKVALQDLETELEDLTLASLNIDGGTSGTIATSSLFVIDQGADGTNRKVTGTNLADFVAAQKTIKQMANVGTTPDTEPTNYYFLAVDASNGNIVILNKEFVETEGSN